MARSRRNLNDSRPQSPSDQDSSDELEARSPVDNENDAEAPRGRTGKLGKSKSKDDLMDTRA